MNFTSGHKLIQGFLTTVSVAVMLQMCMSCTSDDTTVYTGQAEGEATVHLTLKVGDSPITRSLSSANESTVSDVSVLIFDSDSRLVGSTYVDGLSTSTSATATVSTHAATGCTVYAIANTGSASYFSGVNTISQLDAAYVTLTGAAALGDDATGVIMAGSTSGVTITSDGTNSISVTMEHLCSKLNFSIVPSSGITITGYRLCNAALGSYITDSHTSAGTAVTPPANSSGDSYGDFDAVTLSSPTAGTAVTPPVYYVYENLAGSNSSCTTEQLRTSTNAPTNAMYLLVYAKTSVSHSTYRIYLGGMTNTNTPEANLTNFNIYRNMNYSYTVNINGFGEDDTRVTCTIDVLPSIGNIYYSDGTWSSTLDESKTPVGIVFSTTTSTTDYNNGYTHGYVMALKNAASGVGWCSSSAAYVSTQLQASLTNTVALEKSNWDGLTETNAIKAVSDYSETNYPACYDAVNYNAALPSSGTSGWYLPSMGQWYLIVKNLGGVTTAPTSNTTSTPNYGYWTNSSISAATAINTYLNKAGSSNVETIDCNSSTIRWYWCSSEYSGVYASLMYFHTSGYLYLLYADKSYTNTYNRVRPVLAF